MNHRLHLLVIWVFFSAAPEISVERFRIVNSESAAPDTRKSDIVWNLVAGELEVLPATANMEPVIWQVSGKNFIPCLSLLLTI